MINERKYEFLIEKYYLTFSSVYFLLLLLLLLLLFKKNKTKHGSLNVLDRQERSKFGSTINLLKATESRL
jgi:hypothetical protein